MNNKVILGLAVVGLTVALATTTFAQNIAQMGGNMMGQTNQQTHHGAANSQHHRSDNGTHHANAGKFLNNNHHSNVTTKGTVNTK